MAMTLNNPTLAETFGPSEGTALRVKQAILVVLGIAALTIMAKVQVFLPGNPVPITLGTFGVLTIGAAYGARLGVATILGYLVGYVLATIALGFAAAKGWDRSVGLMALAMLIGNAMIYVPGLLWLNGFAESWSQTLAWGITPFLIGDAIKLGLAALLLPAVWKLVGKARG